MKKNRAWSGTDLAWRYLHSGFVLLSCASALLSGCSVRRRPSIAWTSAVQVRPATPPQVATLKEIPEEQIPDLQMEAPSFPLRLVSVRSGPARPRVATPSSGNAGSDADKSDASLVVPQLSVVETAAAQQQTNQNLNIAEKNLESTQGKQLNAAQLDRVSKIRGFIKDAREAAQNADWARARSLSKKAQVLSEELVSTH